MHLLYLGLIAAAEDSSSDNSPSIISDVFEGRLVNSIQCASCRKVIYHRAVTETLAFCKTDFFTLFLEVDYEGELIVCGIMTVFPGRL